METTPSKRMQLLSGSSDSALAERVAAKLGVKVGEARLERFANDEINCHLGESVREADVFIFQTHAILSGPATKRLEKSAIDRVVVTDTLPIPPEKQLKKIEVVSVAPIIADAVSAIFHGQSVSKLFQGDNQL